MNVEVVEFYCAFPEIGHDPQVPARGRDTGLQRLEFGVRQISRERTQPRAGYGLEL